MAVIARVEMIKERLQRFLQAKDLRREMTVGAVDTHNRTVELAFSSTEPVDRWGVKEVLSHEKDAVDLSRLNNDAALLFNHDPDKQLGVVQQATIDSKDGMGRAVVRFGNSDFANEKFQDVQDGILKKVSVGYRIKAVKLTEESEDGPDTYTVTSWQPHEISFVTIPADDSVGVGRSLDDEEKNQNQKPKKNTVMRDQIIALLTKRGVKFAADATDAELASLVAESEPQRINVESERTAARDSELSRVRSIMEMGARFNCADIATDSIKEGKSVEETRGLVLDAMEKRSKGLREGISPVGLNQSEVRNFSFVKLLRALADPQNRGFQEEAAFEIEACNAAAAKISHREIKGMLIPIDVLTAPMINGLGQRAEGANIVSITSGTGYTGTAGNTVQTSLLASSFIEVLRNKTLFLKLARQLGGLVGNVDLPKQTDHAIGTWIGEDAAATLTGPDFGIVALSPKTVAAYTGITRKTLHQSSLAIEQLVREDLMQGLGLAIDTAGFYGTGSSYQPLGIANTSGINGVNFSAAGTPTFNELVEMETLIAQGNADVDSMYYIINPTTRGYAKVTRRLATSTDSQTIWEPGNTINGYSVGVTNQINSGDVFFGNFMDVVAGLWSGLEIIVDPYTQSTKGRLQITTMQDVDIGVRRGQSFTYGTYVAGQAGDTLAPAN